MKWLHSILFLSGWLLFPFCLSAQTIATKQLHFEALTISDGLSQGMINCMLQDHYGFMWFGTKDGLNRFDGYRFIVYRHDPADATSIADNFINALYEDGEGRLWVGTASRGLDVFDRNTETFLHFRHDEKINRSISDDRINKITGDAFGNIWVSTFNGLNQLLCDKNAATVKQQFSASSTIIRYFRDECNFTTISDGTLWGSALHYGSYRIHPSPAGALQIDTLDMSRYCWYPERDKGLEQIIRLILEDTAKHEMFIITEYAIAKVDMQQDSVEIVSRQRNYWGIIGRQGCMDQNGILWLSETDWLEQYDVVNNKWYRLLADDPAMAAAVSNASITYRDRSGLIWIGTKGHGILKHNPRGELFHKTDHTSVQWMAPSDNDSSIIVLKDRRFLCTYNFITQEFTTLNDSTYIPQITSIADFGITNAAVQDRNGIFWLCKQSLLRFDPSSGKISYPRTGDHNVFPVFLDREQRVWFGTDKLLSMLDPVSGKITDYNYPVAPQRQPYEFLQCMIQDDDGIFWLGTTKGLLRFNQKENTWQQFKNDPADTSTLSFDLIFTLCNDPLHPEKFLWIGTNGGGINRFDKQTGKVKQYSMKNGMPNNVAYGILSDEDGNLWISTNNGLSKFNPSNGTFKNYETKDGLQGNEFNRYGYCKTKNGLLFFGGIDGFNYFHPRDLADNPFIPEVQITDFRLRNKPVSFSTDKSPLTHPVFLTEQIVLPYRDNMISFEFSSMDFTATEKNQYRYRLEGFDHDWIESGNAHSATYTNLDPGAYTFTVLGSNNDGLWNEKGKSILLTILPPWYMTWWFRIAVVLAIAGVLYAFYRYRLQKALELMGVRNRIAQDLHDEIGSNLSTISIFSEVAQAKSNDASAPLLKKISDYTHVSQEAMNDIVWMINARNDRFENIIVRMRELAAELFEAKNYKLILDFDERLNNVKLGMDARKNFYLIYKEALNNIAKYADCSNVWIEMKLNHSSVILRIADDGKGFETEGIQSGNGLMNMKRRAEVLKGTLHIFSERDKGTKMELSFNV